ncbi:MAG TPA: YtxH domain-containing protein [Candidatus Angelobacter sp.]|nr:YtxH domain-containing protein [Candidatus Angelobacter sp.]
MKSFLAGLSIGIGLGVLFAPLAGHETRGKIGERAGDLADKARDFADQGRERVRNTVSAIRSKAERIANSDTVSAIRSKADRFAEGRENATGTEPSRNL